MKSVHFWLLLLLLTWSKLGAQPKYWWVKVNDQLKNPLEFVAVGVPGTSIGTMTNDNGVACLISDSRIRNLRVSCLGYLTVDTNINDLMDTVNITLKATSYLLPEPTISSGKLTRVRFGLEKERTRLYTNFAIQGKPRQNLGSAMGKIIDFGKSPHLIEAFSIYLASCTFDTAWLRLSIYEADGHEPGEPLLSKGILIPVVNHNEGWLKVQIKALQLIVKGEVFFCLEWVGYSGKVGYLSVPLSMPRPFANHYYRYGSQNNWKRHRLMSTSMVIDAWKSNE